MREWLSWWSTTLPRSGSRVRVLLRELRFYIFIMARCLSWLERRPVTAEVDGSSPFRVARFDTIQGILAQLGEHLPYKQRVTGSSPVGPIHL